MKRSKYSEEQVAYALRHCRARLAGGGCVPAVGGQRGPHSTPGETIRALNHSGLREEDLLDETVASRPLGREHSSTMLGGGTPPSLMPHHDAVPPKQLSDPLP